MTPYIHNTMEGNHYASKIKMPCEGTLQYSDLYDSVIKPTTSKTNGEVTELVLKKILHCDATRGFRVGKEINYIDLEKKA